MYPESVQYTFWSARQNLRPLNRGWRLDYFLLSSDYESKYNIELIDATIDDRQMGSDHCPIALRLRLPEIGEAEDRANEYAVVQSMQAVSLSQDYNT